MSNFYTEKLAKLRVTSVQKSMDLLEPGTRAAVNALITEAKSLGKTLVVIETYRTQARQTALFNKKATKLKKVGCHGYGVAADLGLMENGKYIGDGFKYKFMMDLCKKHGLISGYDWGDGEVGPFVDAGHVQRIPIWRQNALFAGKWYPPPVGYDPYKDTK